MPKIAEKAKPLETATNCQNGSAVFWAFLGLAAMPKTAKSFAKKRFWPKGFVFSGLALLSIFARNKIFSQMPLFLRNACDICEKTLILYPENGGFQALFFARGQKTECGKNICENFKALKALIINALNKKRVSNSGICTQKSTAFAKKRPRRHAKQTQPEG